MEGKLDVYTFPVCVTCKLEIDESNENKHQGQGHEIQRLELAPVSMIGTLVSAAVEVAEAYDSVIDQEIGVEGDATPTDEAEAVRGAVRALGF
jgi:hypothetical protein